MVTKSERSHYQSRANFSGFTLIINISLILYHIAAINILNCLKELNELHSISMCNLLTNTSSQITFFFPQRYSLNRKIPLEKTKIFKVLNGTPLQCSCLENPRDGGAWWAAVSGVAPSRTRLKRLSSSSSNGS